MSTDLAAAGVARAERTWLTLREPADARARTADLVTALIPLIGTRRPVVVHDLGSGTGSMRRWLAPHLPRPQHWVEHDRDVDLLSRGADDTCVRTVSGELIDLLQADLLDASLITCSALLDVLTLDELTHIVDVCARVRSPLLLSLSVTGVVDLEPADPLDERIRQAFNDHQRRVTARGRLLGPDAVAVAKAGLAGAGATVESRPSPWRLGPTDWPLVTAWLDGWLSAALEQDPDLRGRAGGYATTRQRQISAGALRVVVQHDDLLAWWS